jgi:hypothetical protein
VVRILSEPKGARIFLDTAMVGTTPQELTMEAGDHLLVLQKDWYYTDSLKFSAAKGKKKEISRILNPHFGKLEIISLPEPDADIYLDNTKIGTTPFLHEQYPSGTYQIRLVRTMYFDTTFTITVEDMKMVRCIIPMAVNYAELTVNAPWSKIFLNDSLVSNEQYYSRLHPGAYKVRTERGWQYTPALIQLNLAPKDQQEIQLEPIPKLGVVSVITGPFEASDAEIYMNDERKGRAPFVQSLLIGDYSIVARRTGFVSEFGKFVIRENEKTTVQLKLTSLADARQQAIARWSTWKWISAGVTALAVGTATYFYVIYSKNYKDYQSATDSDQAAASRSASLQNQKYFNITISIGGAAALTSVFSWFMQSRQ